jgi:hypothetical protein
MDSIPKELYSEFTKGEIISMCEELEIKHSIDENSRVLVKKILENVEEEGVPEIDEMSDILLEFLVAAEICDENGELISQDDKPNKKGGEAKEEHKVDIIRDLPPCWGIGDDYDPTCAKCKMRKDCIELRISNRPKCFSVSYSRNAEECKVCIEAVPCQNSMNAEGA